mmetsp:Transcript_91741/g.296814  ORF Transcript_91741/g.296814 Transcript_91741/m.296814 type:complete len:353 (-) Transcript_91741:605-1663(-)
MEGEIPSGVPREFPLVRHRDDVAVVHVVPIAVPDRLPFLGRLRAVRVAFEKLVEVIIVKLLGPDHARQGLALDALVLEILDARLQYPIELLRLKVPCREDFLEGLEGLLRFHRGEPHLEGLLVACRDDHLDVKASFRSCRCFCRAPVSLDDIPVECVLVRPFAVLAAGLVHLPFRCHTRRRFEGKCLFALVIVAKEVGVHLVERIDTARAEVGRVVVRKRRHLGRPRFGVHRVTREVKGPEARVVTVQRRHVRLVVAHQDLLGAFDVKEHIAELRVLDVDTVSLALHGWLLRILAAPRPCVAEEGLGQDVQLGGIGAAVVGDDLHVDVVDGIARILDVDVEVSVLIEDAGVH